MWRVRSDSISMERLDGETILINFDSGEYFSFRGAAADILWLIDSAVDEGQWGRALEQAFPDLRYDADITADVDGFLRELFEAGIIEATDEPGGDAVSLPSDYVRGAWSAPSVHANDDLADLLVIDPIHDASEDGWPQTKSD
jgi:hypothetical protein